jgi:thiosulfate dehydrogenase (quinone) large subunit
VTSRRDSLADIESRLEGFSSPPDETPRATNRRPVTRVPARLAPGLALLPVRLFLGVTFAYAGAQKLSDPGFLHPGAPTYIGTQLHQFAHGTPGGFILRLFAFPAPGFAGVAVALTEIAVGLLTLTGMLTRLAALIGLALNLLLFLTNTWNTYPYFLGSDIVFVFAWLPFVLTGATGQPALDHVIEQTAQRRALGLSAGMPTAPSAPEDVALTRRTLLARGIGATALLTGFIAGISALAKGSYREGTLAQTLGRGSATGSTSANRRQVAQHRSSASSSGLPAGAQKLGPASQLPAGQAAYYHDPVNGSPDIVVRESNGTFAAHSAICTHAGCTVQYSGGQLLCPCHGSIFDARTGAVLQGPAVAPLPARRVVEHGGQLYAVPS